MSRRRVTINVTDRQLSALWEMLYEYGENHLTADKGHGTSGSRAVQTAVYNLYQNLNRAVAER